MEKERRSHVIDVVLKKAAQTVAFQPTPIC
jgi:hypothetical protein